MDNKKYKKMKEFDRRTSFLQICFVIFAVALLSHLFFKQIVDLKHYRLKAKKQRSFKSFVMRGDIFDRNGIKLAADKITYDIYAHPANYKLPPEEMAEMLAPYLKMSKHEITQRLNRDNPVITLKKGVDKTDAQAIKSLGLRSALSMGKKNTRVYPQEDMASHVLGYYNFDDDISS
ncbi:hypothetical protein IJV79_03335, partial [bacterium]|nr:hypothetical protein [bacterium]